MIVIIIIVRDENRLLLNRLILMYTESDLFCPVQYTLLDANNNHYTYHSHRLLAKVLQ